MKKELKHLKRFENEMINEEVSMEQVALIMQAITATGQVASPYTISLQQAMQNSPFIFKAEIGVARTSDDEVWYNIGYNDQNGDFVLDSKQNEMAVQENMPIGIKDSSGKEVRTHYVKGTIGGYKKSISESGPVLENFKYISQADAKKAGVTKLKLGGINNASDLTDFLKIGDKVILDGGQMNIDLSNTGLSDSTEVIASGNGVLLLIRIAAINQKNMDKGGEFLKFNIVKMKSVEKNPVTGKIDDTDFFSIKTLADKTEIMKRIDMAFQLAHEDYDRAIKQATYYSDPSDPKSGSSTYKQYKDERGNVLDFKKDGSTSEFAKVQTEEGKNAPIIRGGKIKGTLTKNMYQIVTGGDGLVAAPEVGDIRDENVLDFVEGQLTLLNDFLLFEIQESASGKEGLQKLLDSMPGLSFKQMSREEIKEFLGKFKKLESKSERDNLMKEFIGRAMEIYKENLSTYVKSFSKKNGISAEEVMELGNMDKRIDNFINGFQGANSLGKSTKKTIPGEKVPVKKAISTESTEHLIGKYAYQIRKGKTETSTNFSNPNIRRGIEIKKESRRFIKTFESFQQNKK